MQLSKATMLKMKRVHIGVSSIGNLQKLSVVQPIRQLMVIVIIPLMVSHDLTSTLLINIYFWRLTILAKSVFHHSDS